MLGVEDLYLDLWLRVGRRVTGAVRVAPSSKKFGHFEASSTLGLKRVTRDYYLNIKLNQLNINDKMQWIT